jgi:hypothetical protein
MFNEIYKQGLRSADRAAFPDKTKVPIIAFFVSRITIANSESMFNFCLIIWTKLLFPA